MFIPTMSHLTVHSESTVPTVLIRHKPYFSSIKSSPLISPAYPNPHQNPKPSLPGGVGGGYKLFVGSAP